MNQETETAPYNFGFIGAALRPDLIGVMAERFAECGSWDQTRVAVLETNALQCRATATAVRLERELRQRLETLTPAQLAYLNEATLDDRVALSWLATVKRYTFLYDFATELLRAKLEIHDTVLRSSDYEGFIDGKSSAHSELETLADSTAKKIRSVLLNMLRDARVLVKGPELGALQRPALPLEVADLIRADSPRWLSAFLVPDSEIRTSY